VLDALPFADQPGARDRPVVDPALADLDPAAVELLAEFLQPPQRLRLQATKRKLLESIAEPRLQVFPVERRRLLDEQVPPPLLQFGRRRRLQRVDLRQHPVGHCAVSSMDTDA
jgi:hypothetical protein